MGSSYNPDSIIWALLGPHKCGISLNQWIGCFLAGPQVLMGPDVVDGPLDNRSPYDHGLRDKSLMKNVKMGHTEQDFHIETVKSKSLI